MKTRNWFRMYLPPLFLFLVLPAFAQEAQTVNETTAFSTYDPISGFSSNLRGRSEYSNLGRELIAELEQSGVVNRALRSPYRVALPLVSFGHTGPKLMVTYARRLPGTSDGGVLFFIHIPTH